MPTCVSIDGEIFSADDARVSIFDHGFLYGDSIYEAFRTYRTRPILLDRNFARLERAAHNIGLVLPWPPHRLRTEIHRTIDHARNPGESLVRVIVTRGVGGMTPDPVDCAHPSVIVIVLPLSAPAQSDYRDGIAVTISSLKRDTHIASIKTGNLIHQVLGAQEARAKGAMEAIFLTAAGHVSDGTRSNIYFVAAGEVVTPSGESGIVEGITRSLVFEVARTLGIRVREECFAPDRLRTAEEVFITSTTRGILPVSRIDGVPVGDRRVGPVTRRLMDGFEAAVGALVAEESPG
jgi:branched-chain amino acid aminotransferase